MTIKVSTVSEYLSKVPEDRKEYFNKLREVILENLPKNIEEGIQYGMIGYYVPHSIYPEGYHVNPSIPLPFMSLASQKNHIAFYHSGMYADPELYEWFTEQYKEQSKYKIDMGKSCIRFKKFEDIPYRLIGELVGKMSVAAYIEIYEHHIKK